MKRIKPGAIDLYFRFTDTYSIRHLVTEVEDDQIRTASQRPAIVRLAVGELVQLLTA